MADGLVQVPADSTGKKIDTSELTVGANTVERQRMVIADSTSATALATVTAGNALKVDGSAVTQPVSGTVTTSPPSNASTNIAQVAGTTADTNSGTKSAGTLRVVLATDQPQLTNKLLVTPDSVALPANQSVNLNQVAGAGVATGNGTAAGTQRVSISSDNTAFSVNAVESGTWTVQPGNTANTTPWLMEERNSTKITYSAAKNALATAATATDIFTITGSGTKTVRVLRLGISGTATTTLTTPYLLIKRSAADTAGTSGAVTAIPNDSNNAAATATVLAYTANPTLGTTVGTLAAATVTTPIAATGNSNQPTIFDFGQRGGQPIVLRGTGEVLAVNLNSITISGSALNIWVEWTEE